MKKHITEDELIKHRFGLADEGLAKEISEHLADCADCSAKAEKLKKKFAALDLLKTDSAVSDEFIAQTTQSAVNQRRFLFSKPAWIGAAAAVLLIGIFALTQNMKSLQVQEDKIAAVPKPTRLAETDIAKGFSENTDQPYALSDGRAGLDDSFVPEKPPFAPASAIELVTLPRRDDVQITIYNSADLTLVREKRVLTLKRGWNWLQFMWANTLIDPTSLSLKPLKNTDKVDIQQLVFPARLKDIGRWLIRSEIEGPAEFEITYFTSGLSWRAFYMGTLSADEQKMDLQGYVRIANNSGETYEDAQTRLIVGQVHQLDKIAELARRQYPYGSPIRLRAGFDADSRDMLWNMQEEEKSYSFGVKAVVGGVFSDLEPKEIKKQGLSEYFLYTIEGTETIEDKWAKRLLSFETADIPVKSLYKYDENRWGKQTERFVSFANDDEHELGGTPIPNGNMKIYSAAAENSLSYVGASNIKYIPVDEEVELDLGAARLVSAEPVLMNLETANYVFDSNDNISGSDDVETWQIELTNSRPLSVDIEITRDFGTSYWTLQHDKAANYKKHDATRARFTTTLPPHTKQSFTYTVIKYHGTRREKMLEQKGD